MGWLFVLFLLLLVGGAIASTIYYFYSSHRAEVTAERDQFQQVLVQSLQHYGPKNFNFKQLVLQSQVSQGTADTAAVETYSRIFRLAVADGLVTATERHKLDEFSTCLCIPGPRVRQIESHAKQVVYEKKLDAALADGSISPAEAAELEHLRQTLQLSLPEVQHSAGDAAFAAYKTCFRQHIQSGTLNAGAMDELSRLRCATGLTEADAYATIREDALDLYRQQYCHVKQDGVISPEEEQMLSNLQAWLRIPDFEVAAFQVEMAHIKKLASLRAGELPRQQTRKLLEGGELCHWESPCQFQYEVAAGVKSLDGDITITSDRVIFSSTAKGFEFKPSRIVDIANQRAGGVVIKTSTRQGTGRYLVSETELFAAVLEGVVRKHKFLAAETFTSTSTRHIPDRVKQEVWARDGGRCTRCGANDYLEFDHIIPRAKGGANTTNNVQLLCRRCNSQKSDRI